MRMRVPTKTLLLAALWLGPDCIIVEFGPPGDRDRDGDGFTEADGDCNDSAASWSCSRTGPADIHPGAPELCNGIDDDCDGETDEDPAEPEVIGFEDNDSDGHGDPDAPILGCFPACVLCTDGPDPPGGDCEDDDPSVFPGAAEDCNGIDDDCDGQIDSGSGVGDWWYPDADGDGYGDGWSPELTCTPPAGWLDQGGDCQDDDANVFPGAAEACGDALDSDCDREQGQDEADCLEGDDDSAR